MKFRNILYILLAGIFLSSCKKTFLDLNPYNAIDQSLAITNESDMATAVNGIYAQLRATNLYGRNLPIVGDLMADNVWISVSNSNRYISEFNYTMNNGNAEAAGTWGSAYVAIARANNVINSTLPSSANVSQLKGEALTMRALMYFNLVNYFARPYTDNPTADGVPIVLAYDPFVKQKRNTVAEVYAQIDKDLNDAFTMMTNTSKNSSYITKYVARALQARVALFKGDYATAKTIALDVVNNGGYTLTPASNLVNYWKNATPVTTKVETIFEISADNVSNNGTNQLSALYEQTGGAYGDALATDELYNKYSATDARIGLFITTTRAGLTVRAVNKYPNTNNTSEKDDLKVIRYAEVILTLAEAYARTNDETNARLYLNMLAKQRDPSFAGYTSAGAQLLSDIILERRKELAFEGMRYLDLQRLKADVVRTNLNSNYSGVGQTPLIIPYTDTRRIWPIPLGEINVNPITQNPGY